MHRLLQKDVWRSTYEQLNDVYLRYHRRGDSRMKAILILITLLAMVGMGSAATLTAHVNGCGGVASDDSLLDTLPDGYTYDSPINKYISLKKGWLMTDTDGYVTWDGPVQVKTWTVYYAVKVMSPTGVLQSHTAKIVMMPCI